MNLNLGGKMALKTRTRGFISSSKRIKQFPIPNERSHSSSNGLRANNAKTNVYPDDTYWNMPERSDLEPLLVYARFNTDPEMVTSFERFREVLFTKFFYSNSKR